MHVKAINGVFGYKVDINLTFNFLTRLCSASLIPVCIFFTTIRFSVSNFGVISYESYFLLLDQSFELTGTPLIMYNSYSSHQVFA